MKYMVVECHRSYAVLLDEEGRFHHAANLHYQVGQRVTDPVLMLRDASPRAKRMIRIGRTITIVFLSLLLILGIVTYRNLAVRSVISLDMGAAVRIELNRDGRVVDVDDENQWGDDLLEDYDWEWKERTVLVRELLERASRMGYLSDEQDVSYFIETRDQEHYRQYNKELKEIFGEDASAPLPDDDHDRDDDEDDDDEQDD